MNTVNESVFSMAFARFVARSRNSTPAAQSDSVRRFVVQRFTIGSIKGSESTYGPSIGPALTQIEMIQVSMSAI